MGLGQYNSLGEYCGPHAASSVLLILLRTTEKMTYINDSIATLLRTIVVCVIQKLQSYHENGIIAYRNRIVIHKNRIVNPKVQSEVQSYVRIFDGDLCPRKLIQWI